MSSEDHGERLAVLETKEKTTAQALAAHVKHCSKIQTYGLAIGCVTFGLVASDSPKVAKLTMKIAELFLG